MIACINFKVLPFKTLNLSADTTTCVTFLSKISHKMIDGAEAVVSRTLLSEKYCDEEEEEEVEGKEEEVEDLVDKDDVDVFAREEKLIIKSASFRKSA